MRIAAIILALGAIASSILLGSAQAEDATVHVVTPTSGADARLAQPLEIRLEDMQWRLVSPLSQPGNGLLVYAGTDRAATGAAAAPYLLIQPAPAASDSGVTWYRFAGADRRHIVIGDGK